MEQTANLLIEEKYIKNLYVKGASEKSIGSIKALFNAIGRSSAAFYLCRSARSTQLAIVLSE